jgi:glutathione synthase/RimK-type ligase-like ATP-grasp enzyme
MRLLLTDGTGLTSRQVATQAAALGHVVHVLAPTRLGPASFTRHVRRVHRVPAFGREPEAWLDAALRVLGEGAFDVLLPTQEQVAILARDADRARELGVGLAVPSFAALLRVQDKAAQARTLRELDLPHPRTAVVGSAEEALAALELPMFVKAPIGTASAGVRRVTDRAGLRAAAAEFLRESDVVVVQQALDGPLVMAQSVFCEGRLVAWHANVREREGAGGGSSAKRSLPLPAVRSILERLGADLGWHGALSFDAIAGPDGTVSVIDVNPRLVEPGNAWRSGVDLVGALAAVSLGQPAGPLPSPAPGVRTHQLLLAVLGAAEQGRGRRGVARELAAALARRGPYRASAEELTPVRGDPFAAVPVLAAAAATLASPGASRWFTDGSVAAYALTPAAWRAIAGPRPAPGTAPSR